MTRTGIAWHWQSDTTNKYNGIVISRKKKKNTWSIMVGLPTKKQWTQKVCWLYFSSPSETVYSGFSKAIFLKDYRPKAIHI